MVKLWRVKRPKICCDRPMTVAENGEDRRRECLKVCFEEKNISLAGTCELVWFATGMDGFVIMEKDRTIDVRKREVYG